MSSTCETIYPEHEKLAKVKDESQAIGTFLDWLSERGEFIAAYRDGEFSQFPVPVNMPITSRLAAYFEIDEDKLEEEKRAMLRAMRKAAAL